MGYLFALAGNQNCGKTTLFNQLTGSNQHVGNFPGVTVEKKEGTIQLDGPRRRWGRNEEEKGQDGATLVDLPGIYSLSPYTAEEVVTRDFLVKQHPDAIINIIDATNIERNLYLTLQLIELGIPMVLALNMMDEVRASGSSIDVAALSKELGIPAVPISASKGEGVADLAREAMRVASTRQKPSRLDFCTGPVHRAIHATAHVIENHTSGTGFPARFAASKILEGDEPLERSLGLDQADLDIIGHVVEEMERETGTDREAALADMRYSYIEGLCSKVVTKRGVSRDRQRSERIDGILTHRIFAIPVFLLIMFAIFGLTFGWPGSWFSDLFSAGVDWVTAQVDAWLTQAQVSGWMHSLVIDGVFAGVGSVLSFLPVIMLLFFFLSLLEDSGYMARVAFVMDKLLRRIGLSGRSFVPMLMGFGCSVPAIMATRTLASRRDRVMTILLVPFMSCSAKLPIYAVFCAAFFPDHAAVVMICLYVLGMVTGILAALVLKNSLFRGNPVPFVMELPNYRMPSLQSVLLLMWEKAKDFLQRAFTIIFLASLVVWFLQSFDPRFNLVSDSSTSMLAALGGLVAPIFAPLGFGDWRLSTALITGLTAKETVVSTLAVLLGAGTDQNALVPLLHTVFTPLTAVSFLTFTLLYMPCVASFAAIRRELASTGKAVAAMACQTGVAWVVAFVVYHLGAMILGVAL